MASWMPSELADHLQGGPAAAAGFFLLLWCLMNCFLGYILFRVVLAASGLAAGAAIGVALVAWRLPSPSGLEYFLGGLVVGGLLGLGSWYLYRLAFAIGVAAGVGTLIIMALGSPVSAGWWILAAAAAVPAGVAAFAYLRGAFILLTGLAGGFGAVFCAAGIFAGSADGLLSATLAAEGSAWLTLMLLAIALALSAAGMYSQSKLVRIMRVGFLPPGRARARPSRPAGLADHSARPP